MNNLPTILQEAILAQIDRVSLNKLGSARQDLSNRYRERGHQKYLNNNQHHLAYLLSRMPATYAVVEKVLNIFKLQSKHPCHTLLDLGAGPGTVAWAVSQIFPELKQMDLLESDPGMIQWGRHFAALEPHFAQTVWTQANFVQHSLPESDLVTASYALSEISASELEVLLPKIWKSVRQYLILIEPGTPYGFRVIRQARDFLLKNQAFILAPCQHTQSCPLAHQGWCHFSERINRSKEERLIKEAQLSYEDEKFSYLIVAKENHPVLYQGTIIHTPQKGSGHIHLSLCTAEGLQKQTISKKQGDLYRQVKKAEWGDFWSF